MQEVGAIVGLLGSDRAACFYDCCYHMKARLEDLCCKSLTRYGYIRTRSRYTIANRTMYKISRESYKRKTDSLSSQIDTLGIQSLETPFLS